jgi:hypothetical protein
MTAATACLQQGDNPCVIAALQGRAKTAPEHELLIETLRAVGRSGEAQKYMATYVARFPDERRAATYKRLLAAQAGSDGAPKPAPSTSPSPDTAAAASEPAPPPTAAPEPAPAAPSAP